MKRFMFSLSFLVVIGLLVQTTLVYAVIEEIQVIDESTLIPISGSRATLERRSDSLMVTFDSSGLPSAAYSFWLAVFNNPTECATSPCSGADLAGSPAAQGVAFNIGGGIIESPGNLMFTGMAMKGVLPTEPGLIVFDVDNTGGEVLINPFTAEVHVVARDHGAPIEGRIDEQTSRFDGGCDVNECINRQVAIFQAPTDDGEPTPHDGGPSSNVFFMSLSDGLNMISLPLKPAAPYTARAFAEQLGATTVIRINTQSQQFEGFTPDAPDDGFAIDGGQGYIVNVTEDKQIAFVGAAWTNLPAGVEAAPSPVRSEGAWALVVSGRIPSGENEIREKDGYLVTIRNTRTNAIATDHLREGYFAAAFADLSRQTVVEVGDQLEVTVRDRAGEVAADRMPLTVTPEVIRQALLPVTLSGIGKPNHSLLLQNYPNPFNPETWIPYQLQYAAPVVIRIYDTQGSLVRTLDLGLRATGFYQSRARAAY